MRDVIEGSFRGRILVISHRWPAPGQPDPDGVQEREIKEYLNSPQGREIELVWHDVSAATNARLPPPW